MTDSLPSDVITDESTLRTLYPEPAELAAKKTLAFLDKHCRTFIAHSPFVAVGTARNGGGGDVSPRGDAPGFVQVLDDTTLLIPDRLGNNRVDTMSNIVNNADVGLMFMIPGIEEILRVNGRARIIRDAAVLARFEVNGKVPKAAILVTVREAFLHCSKAVRRARLWQDDYRQPRDILPPLGKMLKDQIDTAMTAEEAEELVQESVRTRLY